MCALAWNRRLSGLLSARLRTLCSAFDLPRICNTSLWVQRFLSFRFLLFWISKLDTFDPVSVYLSKVLVQIPFERSACLFRTSPRDSLACKSSIKSFNLKLIRCQRVTVACLVTIANVIGNFEAECPSSRKLRRHHLKRRHFWIQLRLAVKQSPTIGTIKEKGTAGLTRLPSW